MIERLAEKKWVETDWNSLSEIERSACRNGEIKEDTTYRYLLIKHDDHIELYRKKLYINEGQNDV